MNPFDVLRHLPWLATGSEIDRLVECIGGVVLPLQVRETSAAASRGTAIHRFLARVVEVGREAALEEQRWFFGLVNEEEGVELAALGREERELLAIFEAIDVDSVPTSLTPEVAMAWNVVTGEAEILGQNIARAYPQRGPEWVMLTIDLAGIVGGDVAMIQDYKTGTMKRRAIYAGQLLLASAVFTRIEGLDEAEIANLYHRHDGSLVPDRALVGSFQLEAIEQRVQALPARIAAGLRVVQEGGVPPLQTGAHCEFCPAASACPAFSSAIVSFTIGSGAMRSVMELASASEAQQAQAVELYYLAKRHLEERVRPALEQVASARPIPLGHGMQWGPVPRKRWQASDAAKESLAALRGELKQGGLIREVDVVEFRKHAALASGAK